MNEQKKLVPKRRFKEYQNTNAWEQCEWVNTVDISTNMIDPRTGKYDNLPHIGPGNIESFSGRLYDNVNTVKDDNLISGKFLFNKGDIIYGKINPQLGKYVFAPFEGLASADAYVLNAKNGLEQTFLFTLLQTQHFFKYSVSVSMRSGMPKINRDELNEYKFNAPSVEEQKRIGEFFLSLDHLITLHQRKLEKTKALKSAYLSEMFPAEGECEPRRRFAGFTEAWEQRRLGELMEISSASRVHKEEWTKTGVPFFRSSDVVSAFKGLENDKAFISYELFEELSNKSGKVQEDDLLVTGGGSIGIPYKVKNNEPLYFKDADLIWLKKSVLINSDFLYTYLITSVFRRYVGSITHIGTISHYTIEQAKATPIMMPKIEEQSQIGKFFAHLDHLITLHQRKLEKLQSIKKAYLNEMFVRGERKS
ncbi:restriction endonuclease subunit S [Paenibacillus sp. KN14-4R]|uniref:restriction endonuclease subunit S n=1 Tax=Paenibacillus sp. KN14-4R TaxID=3445773 RepID=UPI003F9EDAAF